MNQHLVSIYIVPYEKNMNMHVQEPAIIRLHFQTDVSPPTKMSTTET